MARPPLSFARFRSSAGLAGLSDIPRRDDGVWIHLFSATDAAAERVRGVNAAAVEVVANADAARAAVARENRMLLFKFYAAGWEMK